MVLFRGFPAVNLNIRSDDLYEVENIPALCCAFPVRAGGYIVRCKHMEVVEGDDDFDSSDYSEKLLSRVEEVVIFDFKEINYKSTNFIEKSDFIQKFFGFNGTIESNKIDLKLNSLDSLKSNLKIHCIILWKERGFYE